MFQIRNWVRLSRRGWIIAATVLLIFAATVGVLLPRALGGPEAIARDFLAALLQDPANGARLRAAAHISDAEDPDSLIDGLSTRVTLEFLRARRRQGAQEDIQALQARPAPARQYVALLRVVESASAGELRSRRFQVTLRQTDDGDWRVLALTASE